MALGMALVQCYECGKQISGTAWTTWSVWETAEGLKVFGEDQNVVRAEPGKK